VDSVPMHGRLKEGRGDRRVDLKLDRHRSTFGLDVQEKRLVPGPVSEPDDVTVVPVHDTLRVSEGGCRGRDSVERQVRLSGHGCRRGLSWQEHLGLYAHTEALSGNIPVSQLYQKLT
jgi:hypothetical protein